MRGIHEDPKNTMTFSRTRARNASASGGRGTSTHMMTPSLRMSRDAANIARTSETFSHRRRMTSNASVIACRISYSVSFDWRVVAAQYAWFTSWNSARHKYTSRSCMSSNSWSSTLKYRDLRGASIVCTCSLEPWRPPR